MVVTELDPRLTFDNFVVGPANRLAAAASRRAADSPGTSYNPLFIYSASGLGKSHILNAIAHHANRAHPDFKVLYQTLERYLEELTAALESGDREVLRERYQDLDLLLLDDVQFLTGQSEAQEMLLRTLDSLNLGESQIVLASDRPPAEIDGLDARLLSRFAGGLIVDIGPPEYETRVAIVRKKAEERSTELSTDVAETIARVPYKNVRELGGALNRVLAVQELEERRVTPDDVKKILGLDGGPPEKGAGGAGDDLGEFMDELAGDVAATVEDREAPWRKALRSVAEAAEAEGFTAGRIRRLIDAAEPPDDPEAIAEEFRQKMTRLNVVKAELERVGNPWPEAAFGVLKDPERLDEAESLLASARERVRPFPPLKPGPGLDELEPTFPNLSIKATRQVATGESPEYTPLYLWSSGGAAARSLGGAGGRTFKDTFPDGLLAVVSVKEFAEDFIHALSSGVAGAWRERWWSADLLILHGLQELSETERAQDEFFHLFEALKRRKSRIILVADRPPSKIEEVDDRLLSRFEGGLVLEVESEVVPDGSDDLSPGEIGEDESEAAGTGQVMIPPLDQIVGQGEERGGLFTGASGSPATGAATGDDTGARDGTDLTHAEAALGVGEGDAASDTGGAAPGEETPDAEAPEEETPDAEASEEETPDAEAPEEEGTEPPGPVTAAGEAEAPLPEEAPAEAEAPGPDASGDAAPGWHPSPENVIVEWPEMGDRVVEDLG